MCGNMISSCKMTPLLMAIFCLVTAGCLNITDQQTSESQHDQVAILKQLRKVNDDGSYTFGYEAGDGSFKVETRDVLGNVKGTFGFVDANGEIKRVTYSSSNGTGFKATTSSPLQERVSVVQSIPRSNRSSSSSSSSTRKPSVVYATSTESSSSTSTSASKLTSAVQSIPRSRSKTTTSASASSTTSTTEQPTKSIFGHYIKGSKYRPRLFVNGQQRPSSISIEEEPEDSQITRPSIEVKTSARRKTFLGKRPVDHTLRPITEEFDDKSEESKSSTTGNTLRRQLQEETTIKVHESRESDENSDVYGGGSIATTRPLFTTSSAPRIIQRLRADRPKMYQHQLTTSSASSSESTPETTEYDSATETTRVYEADNKLAEPRDVPAYFLRSTNKIARDYAPGPVYIRREPDQLLRDLSSSGILTPAAAPIDEDYRANAIDRILARLQVARQHQQQYPVDDDAGPEYPADATAMEPNTEAAPVPVPRRPANYARPRSYPRVVALMPDDVRARSGVYRLQPMAPIDRDYPDYPYRSIVLPPEPPNPIAPPLSRRDFQILLRKLLVSQYGVRALTHPRTYLDDALYDQQSYPTYQTAYHTPPPPPPPPPTSRQLIYEPTRYGERLRDRAELARSYDPALYNNHYDAANYDPIYANRLYRHHQKVYDAESNDETDRNGDEILPPPIREALLLRMLQLAISNDRPISNYNMVNGPIVGTTTPMTTAAYRKAPVRSVQILSDEKSEENKDTIRKKM